MTSTVLSKYLRRLLLFSLVLFYVGNSLALADTPAPAENALLQLEKELEALKKQQQKNSAAQSNLKRRLKEQQEKLSINGFLSAGLTQTNRNRKRIDNGSSNDLSTLGYGKMGLQSNFALSTDTEAVVQFMGRATDNDWNLKTQWAYLSHELDARSSVRAGRLRLPGYLMSEVIDVGFAYPWVEPPQAAYGPIPFENYDGIEYNYSVTVLDWALNSKLFYGNNNEEDATNQIQNRDINGVEIYGLRGPYTVRMIYGREHVELTWDVINLNEKSPARYTGLGFKYDDGDWLLYTEVNRLVTETELIWDAQGFYVTLGHRWGVYTPYITYGKLRSTDDAERLIENSDHSDFLASITSLIFNTEETTYSLGLRREISTGIAAKLELNYYADFDNTNAFFNDEEPGQIPSAIDFDNAVKIDLVIDAVF